jgi:membrane protein
MLAIWGLGGLKPGELAQHVWNEINEDEVFGRAAQLAYYFLLALFPLLLFLMTLLGYFAAAGSQLRDSLIRYLSTVMPGSALQLVHSTLEEVSKARGGGKLSFGILAALWAASNGMGAISETLNIAYDVKERRPWWKVRLVSIGLTISLALLIISALVIVLYGGKIADFIAAASGFSSVFTVTWKVLQWPIALAFLFTTFSLIYYFGPDLRHPKWRWITPGSVTAVILWLLISLALRVYLHFFNSYSVTYGSLGALIILMLWFYLTGVAILIGGEINAEIERAARSRGKTD